MTLPYSAVRDPPVQVQPIVVMRVVSIYPLQQQVRTFWIKVWLVRVFLWWGERPPPHRPPLPVPPLGYLHTCLIPRFPTLNTLPWFFLRYLWPCGAPVTDFSLCVCGGGEEGMLPCPPISILSPPPLLPPILPLPPPYPCPLYVSGILSAGCWGLATRWASSRR